MTLSRESARSLSLGLLLLRVAGGGLIFYGHGLPKLLNLGAHASQFPDPIGLGPELGFGLVTFAETACALMVVAGALTRLAVIPPLVSLAVAGLVFHAADPWREKELVFVFMIPFLALLVTGAGSWSFDGWRARSRPSSTGPRRLERGAAR